MVPACGLSVAFAAVDVPLLLLLLPQPASAAATTAISAAAIRSRRGLKDRWSAPPAQAEAKLWPPVGPPCSPVAPSPSSMPDTSPPLGRPPKGATLSGHRTMRHCEPRRQEGEPGRDALRGRPEAPAQFA